MSVFSAVLCYGLFKKQICHIAAPLEFVRLSTSLWSCLCSWTDFCFQLASWSSSLEWQCTPPVHKYNLPCDSEGWICIIEYSGPGSCSTVTHKFLNFQVCHTWKRGFRLPSTQFSWPEMFLGSPSIGEVGKPTWKLYPSSHVTWLWFGYSVCVMSFPNYGAL